MAVIPGVGTQVQLLFRPAEPTTTLATTVGPFGIDMASYDLADYSDPVEVAASGDNCHIKIEAHAGQRDYVTLQVAASQADVLTRINTPPWSPTEWFYIDLTDSNWGAFFDATALNSESVTA